MRKSIGILLLCACAGFAAPETELKDSSGQTIIRYAIETPEGLPPAGTKDPARQVGLFLCFPEHDRPTGDEIYPVREALRRLGLTGQYILLAGHPQERKFGPKDHEPIQRLIAWALKMYPVNPRRIYMYGKGEGGKISGEFAGLHPNLVTAAISYSWGWWTMPSETTAPLDMATAPEYYMVLGMRDLSYHITTVRDTYSRVQAKGYHVIYREFDELGARTYHPPSNDDAIAWASRMRNKNIPPNAEERKLLLNATPEALALVGGPAAGEIVRKQLESADPALRARAAKACRLGSYDEATLAALGNHLTDSSAKVRLAAIQALALHAKWRSAAAQAALIDLATHAEKAVAQADRVAATDALGEAVRMQIRGVPQDPPVFAALVSLLTDTDEELRTMASNILAPIRDPEFRGDLGRPEKKAPEGGWQRWLEEITAKNAAYAKDYDVCASHPSGPAELYCSGGKYLKAEPAKAFQLMLQAAEQGYVPAQAAIGMLYAIGKGVQQNIPEARNWWTKAAAAGHPLAIQNAAMVPKGPPAAAQTGAK